MRMNKYLINPAFNLSFDCSANKNNPSSSQTYFIQLIHRNLVTYVSRFIKILI